MFIPRGFSAAAGRTPAARLTSPPFEHEPRRVDVRRIDDDRLVAHDERQPAVVTDAVERADEHVLPADRLLELQARRVPAEAAKIFAPVERAPEPGRADLEPVALLNTVGDVERRRNVARDVGAQLERDARPRLRTTRLLERELEHTLTTI